MATAVRISEELVDEAKNMDGLTIGLWPVRLNIGHAWANVPRRIRIYYIPSLRKS